MADLRGIKPNKRGQYWCNVILSDKKPRLCIAEKIDEEDNGLTIWLLYTNGERVQDEKNWEDLPDKPGFKAREVLQEEINEFFNF